MAGFFNQIHWPQLAIAFFFMLSIISEFLKPEPQQVKMISSFWALVIVIIIASYGGLWG